MLLQQDAGRKVYELQVMPMDFCVAETQGSIGVHDRAYPA